MADCGNTSGTKRYDGIEGYSCGGCDFETDDFGEASEHRSEGHEVRPLLRYEVEYE